MKLVKTSIIMFSLLVMCSVCILTVPKPASSEIVAIWLFDEGKGAILSKMPPAMGMMVPSSAKSNGAKVNLMEA